jgi:GntR family transcriptional regulator
METKLYTELVNDIKNKIISGELNQGERLPSENELLDIYSISKTTIEKGLMILANEGYITTVPRVGNFVSRSHVYRYDLYYNLVELLNATSDAKVLSKYEITSGNAKYPKLLAYHMITQKDGKNICYIENRLFYDDIIDFSKEEVYESAYFDIMSHYYSLYSILKKITIVSEEAPPLIVRHLSTQKGDVILKITTEYWDRSGMPLGSNVAYCDSNIFELVAYASLT